MATHNATSGLMILAWTFNLLLLMIALINQAAGSGRTPPNSIVGIRIPPLQRSETAWAAGHAAGVRPAGIAFGIATVCSITGLFASIACWGSIAAFVIGIVWIVASAVRAANSA